MNGLVRFFLSCKQTLKTKLCEQKRKKNEIKQIIKRIAQKEKGKKLFFHFEQKRKHLGQNNKQNQ